MRSLVFSFSVLIVLSAAFLVVGLLIAFSPTTYLRWLRQSNVGYYAPWLRRWDDNRGRRPFIFGICMALFGVISVVLTVWIHFFQ